MTTTVCRLAGVPNPTPGALMRRHSRLLSALERSARAAGVPIDSEAELSSEAIAAGDVVQLKPSTDPLFGGILMRVMQASAHEVRGYFLRPHRGGCKEAWRKFTPDQVQRIGHATWPESEFGSRRFLPDGNDDEALRRQLGAKT